MNHPFPLIAFCPGNEHGNGFRLSVLLFFKKPRISLKQIELQSILQIFHDFYILLTFFDIFEV